ncbi:MAG TPA: CHASE2 domain-containing protein, partial [Candidatus Methylacidiphilales bacterium]|nr:CHASE2 domain-containing protein [Candidatus Methylacidiphilales bacterium]
MSMAPLAAWIRPRLYHLLAPLVALALVGLLDHYTNLVKRFEYLTVNLRFQARSNFDPPADSRLVFVGIDEPSLQHLGRWPWPRSVEANFVDTISGSGVNPHTLAFDVMFTEDTNKLGGSSAGGEDDDQKLGKSISQLASVITGALRLPEPNDPGAREDAEKRTQVELETPGPTVPLSKITGDIQQIVGSD